MKKSNIMRACRCMTESVRIEGELLTHSAVSCTADDLTVGIAEYFKENFKFAKCKDSTLARFLLQGLIKKYACSSNTRLIGNSYEYVISIWSFDGTDNVVQLKDATGALLGAWYLSTDKVWHLSRRHTGASRWNALEVLEELVYINRLFNWEAFYNNSKLYFQVLKSETLYSESYGCDVLVRESGGLLSVEHCGIYHVIPANLKDFSDRRLLLDLYNYVESKCCTGYLIPILNLGDRYTKVDDSEVGQEYFARWLLELSKSPEIFTAFSANLSDMVKLACLEKGVEVNEF